MAEKEFERIYVIPLHKAKFGTSSVGAPRAMKEIKNFLIKHMKVEQDNIWIDDSLNEAVWSRGKFKVSSKIRVRAVKFDDGIVEASLPELKEVKSRREELKAIREAKEPILKKEEEKEATEEGETTEEEKPSEKSPKEELEKTPEILKQEEEKKTHIKPKKKTPQKITKDKQGKKTSAKKPVKTSKTKKDVTSVANKQKKK